MIIIHKNVIEDYWNNDNSIFCSQNFSYIYKYIYFTNKVNPTKYEKYKYYMMK